MKLIRKGQPGEESPGLLLSDGREVDASSFGEDYDEVFFETDGLERLKNWYDENAEELPLFPEGERYGSPITRPCLLYTSPSPRDVEESRMPSSA